MPSYTFACSSCNSRENIEMSVKEYSQKYANNLLNTTCGICGGKTNRVYNAVSSKISRSSAEIVSAAKEEARKIVEDINRGSSKAIIDVYGDTDS
jgi:hypothetical protein